MKTLLLTAAAVMALSPAAVLAAGPKGKGKGKRKRHLNPKQVVVKMVNAIDTKDWATGEAQFAPKVFVDYSSMTGKPGAETAAKDLVGGWEKLLSKAQTHHMLTNMVTERGANKGEAKVYSHVYASHNAKGVDYWDIYGRYIHDLKKTPNGWKITSMTLKVHGQKGNTKFLEQVTKVK